MTAISRRGILAPILTVAQADYDRGRQGPGDAKLFPECERVIERRKDAVEKMGEKHLLHPPVQAAPAAQHEPGGLVTTPPAQIPGGDVRTEGTIAGRPLTGRVSGRSAPRHLFENGAPSCEPT